MATPSHEGRLARQLRLLGCSCFQHVVVRMLSDHHECPQGSLLPLGLQAPSFPHWTTHSQAPALGCIGQVLTLGAFREPPTLRPSCDGVVDRELLDRHAPDRGRSSLSRGILRRTRLTTPRWEGPREHCALEQYSLSQRRHPERPCRRPLLEVAPPRTMSWR